MRRLVVLYGMIAFWVVGLAVAQAQAEPASQAYRAQVAKSLEQLVMERPHPAKRLTWSNGDATGDCRQDCNADIKFQSVSVEMAEADTVPAELAKLISSYDNLYTVNYKYQIVTHCDPSRNPVCFLVCDGDGVADATAYIQVGALAQAGQEITIQEPRRSVLTKQCGCLHGSEGSAGFLKEFPTLNGVKFTMPPKMQ